jgi:hypothetical protein
MPATSRWFYYQWPRVLLVLVSGVQVQALLLRCSLVLDPLLVLVNTENLIYAR